MEGHLSHWKQKDTIKSCKSCYLSIRPIWMEHRVNSPMVTFFFSVHSFDRSSRISSGTVALKGNMQWGQLKERREKKRLSVLSDTPCYKHLSLTSEQLLNCNLTHCPLPPSILNGGWGCKRKGEEKERREKRHWPSLCSTN